MRTKLTVSLAIAGAAFFLLIAPGWAQTLAEERQRVLTRTGVVKVVQLPMTPLNAEMGLARRQTINEPTATSIATHFAVDSPAGDWGIQIRDAAGAVKWEISSSEVSDGDFWSDDVPGNHVTVEIFTARRNNPLGLTIDKVALGGEKIDPVSIVGDNDMKPIGGQDAWIVDFGRSVARLRFVGDDGFMYFCTAFLVSPELLMTNQHCIATDSERKSAKVDFDFDVDGAKPQTVRLSALLDNDHALDYSIVRLAKASDRPPLPLAVDRPTVGAQMLIVQHPEGLPKKVSIKECKVSDADTVGRGGGLTDFGHGCDTLGGSSGSPVLLVGSRKVLGLHHLGFTPASAVLFNRAVHMDLVLRDLSPETRTELGL